MEEQINICVTCLSTDRRLVPVHKITTLLHEIYFEELQESPGGVCWECRSILAKFYSFKNRAKKAQESLSQTTEHINIKSLTTLSITNTSCFLVCETNWDTKLKEDQDSIKQENVEQTDDNLDQVDESLDNTLVIDEKPIEEPEKHENIHSEADVIENKYDHNLFGKQENISHDEKFTEVTINFESYETKPNIDLPIRTVSRQKKDGVRATKKTQMILQKVRDTDDTEFEEKFVQVVLSEEEMVRLREERRNHPSFRKLPHICHGCVLGFRKEEKYRSHMKKKHDERIGNLVCEVCSVRFPHKLALNKHKRKHYVVYRCRLCKYQGNDLRSAVNHCKIKHAADKPDSIHCSQCHFVAKNLQDLEEHMQTEHQFWCNECGEKFKLRPQIRTHMTRAHSVLRNFVCDICKKTFKTKTRLDTHRVKHSGNIAKKLAYCQQCNVQYKSIQCYRMHLKSSANHSEGYPCSECNKKFGSKGYLKQHYDFYHLRKSQYTCEVCNKLFISNWLLRNHKQLYHGLSRPRNHSCNTCGKKFFSLVTLRNHQFTHSDQRSFMCEDCGDTFKQSATLYRHTQLVHKSGGARKKRDC